MPDDKVDLSKLKIHRGNDRPVDSIPRPRYWLAIYIACGVFLVLAGFFFYRSLTAEEIVEVTSVVRTSPSEVSSLLTASGYVVAQRKASIASKATGRLVYLGFKEGDKVKKDQIIARLESADVEAALAQAKADLDVARAQQNDARQSFERAKTLLDRNLISQADYDAAKARYDGVTATIASREASVQAAEVQVENTRIRAPFDGTILTKNADVGEVVAPFGAGASSRVAVVTIADMSSLEVEADVSESNIERITVDQPCEITLDAYPAQHYRGVVDKIVPTADRAKATVMTKIRFLEIDNRVLPEMSAKVSFLSRPVADSMRGEPKLAVDPSAITTTRDGKKSVFVLSDDHTVVERIVAVGGSIGGLAEITSGLSSGEQVVVRPSEKLYSGAPVKVKGR
jgi:RND family efflux transporter MFP subunit